MHPRTKFGLAGLAALIGGCHSSYLDLSESTPQPQEQSPVERYIVPCSGTISLSPRPITTGLSSGYLNDALKDLGEIEDADTRASFVKSTGLYFADSNLNGEPSRSHFVFSMGTPPTLERDEEDELVKRQYRKSLDSMPGTDLYIINKPLDQVTRGDLELLAGTPGLHCIPMDLGGTVQKNHMPLGTYNALWDIVHYSQSPSDVNEKKRAALNQTALDSARCFDKPLNYAAPGTVIGVVSHSLEGNRTDFYAFKIVNESDLGTFEPKNEMYEAEDIHTRSLPKWFTGIEVVRFPEKSSNTTLTK